MSEPAPQSISAPLQATCLCRQNVIPIKTTLPQPAHICHCTSCRTMHGTLFCMHSDLDELPFSVTSPPPTLKATLTDKSPAPCYIFTCNNCGTWMFATYFFTRSGELQAGQCVSTGCLSLSPEYKSSNPTAKLEDVINITMHCLIKDTIDGGASSWVGDWSKEKQPHFHGRWDEPPLPSRKDAQALLENHSYPTGRKELDGWCKCQGVKLRIIREDESQKYKAILCACDSCRLAAATDIVPFVLVPRTKAFFVKGGADNQELLEWPQAWDDTAKAKFDNMIIYESTPGKVAWGSCRNCGARVFYQRYAKRREGVEVVEPLTGLFGADTTKGILHLDWLDWITSAESGGIGLIEDAEAEGRAGIITRDANERYKEWVNEIKNAQ
ncbi:hypothetical protein TWF694_009414 [Orbilia ellipsospora]|uniref:CENP-V/GFA domain-containing protein n=1 Tax=Orbilia ellipsospora TaxID=2528407 RepID=A0AAV9XAQ3_9PEZI